MNRADPPSANGTRLSLLREMIADDPAAVRNGRERFARTYRDPIVNYMRRSCRLDDHTADDLSQEFLLKKLFGEPEKRSLIDSFLQRHAADPTLRFRGYLFRSLRNFVAQSQRGRRVETFDPTEAYDLADETAAEELSEFERDWARNLLVRAIEQVRDECLSTPGQQVIWEIFAARVVVPALTGVEAPPYEELSAKLGLESPRQGASRLQTAVRKFRDALHRLVVDYLPGNAPRTEEVLAELADLRQAAAGMIGLGVLERFVEHPAGATPGSLAPDAVSLLLVEPLGAESPWSDRDCAGLWQYLLQSKVTPPSSDTLEHALFDTVPDLETYELIKRAAKSTARGTDRPRSAPAAVGLAKELDGLPADLAVLLYLLVVAAARVRADHRLSRDPDERFVERIRYALALPWLDDRSRELLRQWERLVSQAS